jgi:hypothetical protein
MKNRKSIDKVNKLLDLLEKHIKEKNCRLSSIVGTIKQARAFHIILEDEKGKTVIVPTKHIAEKEIQVESGPEPEIPEKSGRGSQKNR